LIPDHDIGIVSTEMLEAFNAWLRANGHKEWSKETFGPRFAAHVETVRHRVVEKRPRQLPTLHRYGWSVKPLPQRPAVYLGVRFRTDFDKRE
jgi:hypothetical protein